MVCVLYRKIPYVSRGLGVFVYGDIALWFVSVVVCISPLAAWLCWFCDVCYDGFCDVFCCVLWFFVRVVC